MVEMNESEVKVKVEFQYTEAEYLAANRLYLFNSSNIVVRLIVVCLLLTAVVIMMSVVVTDLLPIWAMIAFVLLLEGGLVYNLLVRMPRQYFRGDAKFRDKFEVTFSDDGITVKTSQLDSKLSWSLYTRVIEGSEMYLLVYGKETRMMTTIPKRAFKSSQQENRFRELVTRHITDHSVMRQIPAEDNEYTPKSLTPPDWR